MSKALKLRLRPTDVRGPTGQRRPQHSIGCAVVVAQIATGQRKETGWGKNRKIVLETDQKGHEDNGPKKGK